MADGIWKGVYTEDFGCYGQVWNNEFLDLSTPYMRKVDNEETLGEGRGNEIVTTMLLPNSNQLQHRHSCPFLQALLVEQGLTVC